LKINILHAGLNVFFDRKCDIIYGLFHALSDLGHDVTINHNIIERSSLNLVIGSDIICEDETVLDTLVSTNCDYAVYEVENFNGETINYRTNFDVAAYTRLIEHSTFTITPYHHNFKALKKIKCAEKLRYSRWGFHSSMVSNNIRRDRPYKYAAVFIGLIKGDRIEKHKTIKEKFGNRVAFIDSDAPFTIRDYYMSNSKFGLSLSYGATDNFVNPFRLHYMVSNGVPVLSDHVHDEDSYLDICNNSLFERILDSIELKTAIPDHKLDICQANKLTDNLSEIFS